MRVMDPFPTHPPTRVHTTPFRHTRSLVGISISLDLSVPLILSLSLSLFLSLSRTSFSRFLSFSFTVSLAASLALAFQASSPPSLPCRTAGFQFKHTPSLPSGG